MNFRLTKKSAGKSLSKFHILNSAGDIVGSVNVPNAEANDLLRHWQGEVGDSPQTTNLSAQEQSPVSALAKEFLKHRRPVSQTNILRGCMG
jgi:hypothetical protein